MKHTVIKSHDAVPEIFKGEAMDIMMGMSADVFFIALMQIVAIDIVLGGDNAIIIALACRNLPPKQKRLGILWGTAGAIILRVILVFFASALMTTPGLRLIGGLLLLWIGVKLLTDQAKDDFEGKIAEKSNLLGAIQTIIIADFVMSLDNALAIAAASKGSMFLVVFGLVVSVPIIIGGSTIILKMMDRYPFIITLGAGLLGWLGGDLIVNDKINATILPAIILQSPWIAAITGACIVVGLGSLITTRRKHRAKF